jgi:hypothetical protein
VSKIAYESRRFTDDAQSVLVTAQRICDEYARQGLRLTLRQLYYQFIARNLFPDSRLVTLPDGNRTKNHDKNYKWLGNQVSDGRVAGLIDWNHITDTSRSPSGGDGGWDSPREFAQAAARQYTVTKWDNQPEYVEVWVEKEALAQVVRRTTSRWNVLSFACKGYTSQSAMHDAAQRIRVEEGQGRKATVIHLGDHDPSGLDMTRDIQDRLRLFWSDAEVDRIALNMDQVLALNPPPSPAKVTDSRARDYIEEYGEDSWELDAIEPAALDTLIEEAILGHLDMGLRQERLDLQDAKRRELSAIADNYDMLLDYAREQGWYEEEDNDQQD